MKKLFFVLFLSVISVAAKAQIDHVSHSADATKFGFVDVNEKWIVSPQWDNASWDAKMQVGIVGDFKGPKGAINVKGEFILPIQYAKVRTNPQSQTLLVAEQERYWYLFSIRQCFSTEQPISLNAQQPMARRSFSLQQEKLFNNS